MRAVPAFLLGFILGATTYFFGMPKPSYRNDINVAAPHTPKAVVIDTNKAIEGAIQSFQKAFTQCVLSLDDANGKLIRLQESKADCDTQSSKHRADAEYWQSKYIATSTYSSCSSD